MEQSSTLPNRTDVLVVGAGVMGTSVAFFLARETDRSVTLVEKDAIAAGSTGDSSAILRHHYGDEAIYTEMAWWSHKFYRSFREETGAPIAHEGSPLVRFAKAGTAAGEYARAGLDVLDERGIPVTVYRDEELREQYPMYDAAGEFDVAVSDDTAAYSDGTDAAMGFARGAREHGATIVTGVTVEAIETARGSSIDGDADPDHVTGVRTDEGTVECDAVVVAAGPWTPRLVEPIGIDVPITPTREQVLLLEPSETYAEAYPSLTPTTGLPGGEWYIRPDFGGGVLVATHRYTEKTDPDSYDDTPDRETVLELVDRIAEAIPELADAGVMGKYCGVYATTPDHDFVIDQAGPDGCYLACGFSGHGFKHAPAVGRIVTDLVIEGATEFVDAGYFSLDRFEDDPAGHGRPDDNI